MQLGCCCRISLNQQAYAGMGALMSIKVRFFASLAESAGRREAECAHVQGMTVARVWRELNGGDQMPSGVLCALNHDYCGLDQVVRDNDEVAYFPPVTGG